jgi:LysM repeat protein
MAARRLKVVVALSLLAFALVGFVLSSVAQAAELQNPLQQSEGTNLLVNPGFEGIGKPEDNAAPNWNNWTRDTFSGAQYGEIYSPEGWVTWWREGGEFRRPECHVIAREYNMIEPVLRVHRGYYSGKCFTYYGRQDAGYLQVVRNIPPGSVVEASFHAHAWSCNESTPQALSCGEPNAFFFRVGIDPNGGTDPFSSNIAWSAPYYHYDKFGLVGPVQATVGGSGAATIFMQANAKWTVQHNDAYMDSATLKLVSTGAAPEPTVEPPPPTSDEPATPVPPANTPVPRTGDETVHVVVAGDTVFGIALAYGIDYDLIYNLNPGLREAAFLNIGQEIIISGTGSPPAAAPTATPEPAEPAAPEPLPTPTSAPVADGGVPAAPAPAAGKASVCVLAFYDANEDMFRQPEANEMLLPNAQMQLLAQSGPVDSYTTDGISEPWCFKDLEPGNYILRHTAPSGYALSDGGQWALTLTEGKVETLEIGYKRDADATAPVGVGDPVDVPDDTTSTDEPGGSRVTNVLNVVLRVSGFIVLALAIAVLVLFVLSRRAA